MGQIKKYKVKNLKGILAVDFDHTINMSNYPATGEERKNAGKYMRKLIEDGYGIVINTCREGLALAEAIKWMDEHEIPYHYVNCNFPHLIKLFNADCRKISADLYIDDKNLQGLPKWKDVYQIVKMKLDGDS